VAATTAAIFLVTGCPTADDPSSSEDAVAASDVDGYLLTSAHYEADWEWGTAIPADDGGWSVTTDLGYTVHVTRGWLVSYSASLAECTPSAPSAGAAGSGLLDGLFGAGVAFAGHGDANDPSITAAPQAESLTTPELTDLGTTAFPEADYCRLHWVAGAASWYTVDLPEEVDLLGNAVWLEGTWTAPGSDDAVAFVWTSTIANGVLVELDESLVSAPTGEVERAEIRVVRELDRWLDGIDFAALSEDDVGRALMIGLAASTVVEVRLEGP